MSDEPSESTSQIPLLTSSSTPVDGDKWQERLKEELVSLIAYVKMNKKNDTDWFKLTCDKTGVHWSGTCWMYYKRVKYEFKVEFDLPATYPMSPPEIRLPELDGKTPKMYRGGKICCDVHFNPLWGKHAPSYGIAHAMALGLAPWLAVEIPHLVEFDLLWCV
ncbi:hypothetical protein WA538_002095 [Blastocystis sp. DL]